MTTDTDAPLSSRVRPNSEAAPWVVAAIKALERRAQQAEALLQEAMHLHCLRDPDDELEVLRADVAAHFDQVKP